VRWSEYPSNRDGIRVDVLRETDADAVVLTPSHQWPTGQVLSAQNRSAVLRWAGRRGAVVIEDDYDAEYRYDRTPVGAMQGLARITSPTPDRQARPSHPGCGSGGPCFRATWPALWPPKIAADRGSPALEQLALSDLITRGEFDRHLRRMRPVYRRRRDALLTALARRLPWLEPSGISAGLHLVTWLPPHLDETTVVEAALRVEYVHDHLAP
jgi:GntR family transcriptional regulator / MocR family aminotransferase